MITWKIDAYLRPSSQLKIKGDGNRINREESLQLLTFHGDIISIGGGTFANFTSSSEVGTHETTNLSYGKHRFSIPLKQWGHNIYVYIWNESTARCTTSNLYSFLDLYCVGAASKVWKFFTMLCRTDNLHHPSKEQQKLPVLGWFHYSVCPTV